MVKILSLGYAVPEHTYTQRQIFDSMQYPRHFLRIFEDSQISERHFCISLDKIRRLSFQEQQEEYARHAPSLALKAITQCLDGRNPQDIGLMTWSTCTGFMPGPTALHYLSEKIPLRTDIQFNNISSQGCEAAFPGLRRCADFTAVSKLPSLAIACELTSLTYFPEPDMPDATNDYELLRANAVFADGCSCALLGYDNNPAHPEIIGFASQLDSDYINDLGYTWDHGRLRVRLSKQVPSIAVMLLGITIKKLLLQYSLTVKDIDYWVIHPPGAVVLDMIRDKLNISEEKLAYSRKALKLYGNTSSCSVGIVGKLLINQEKNPQGYLLMANVGPGMVSNAMLAKFGK